MPESRLSLLTRGDFRPRHFVTLASSAPGSARDLAYDDNGIRVYKEVNGDSTKFYLNGSTILAEYTDYGDATRRVDYIYDESGSVYGFSVNGTQYYYQKNLQGDVIGILDKSGNLLVSYVYTAYGVPTTSYPGVANATSEAAKQEIYILGSNNPFRYRGYYFDTETGFYYLNSRYYDPVTGRFLNADGYASTGQGVLAQNMFAYCLNNPVNRADYTGQSWSEIWEFAKTAVTEIGKAMGLMSPAYAGCGGAAVADGPLPFGDIVAAAGAVLLTVGAIGYGIYQATQAPPIAIPKAETKEKDITIPVPPPKRTGQTYYHVTSIEKASIIATTGVMTGSEWEAGYVYAWKNKPSRYAIKNSGATHGEVVIKFTTGTSFVYDTGIDDPKVAAYMPVVSARPGPIEVWDVCIVG